MEDFLQPKELDNISSSQPVVNCNSRVDTSVFCNISQGNKLILEISRIDTNINAASMNGFSFSGR